MIPQFPNRDLLDVTFEAWKLVGELLSATVTKFGEDPLQLMMPCRHDPELVRLKRYSQREFFLSVDGIDLDEEARKWEEGRPRSEVSADRHCFARARGNCDKRNVTDGLQ